MRMGGGAAVNSNKIRKNKEPVREIRGAETLPDFGTGVLLFKGKLFENKGNRLLKALKLAAFFIELLRNYYFILQKDVV